MDEFISKKTLLENMKKLQKSLDVQTDTVYKLLVARCCEEHQKLVENALTIALSEPQECPFLGDSMNCKPDGENCFSCGWNPVVAKSRLNALSK